MQNQSSVLHPNCVQKFTSSEHFLEITAAHSFSLHTSQGRRRIRRHWQWGLEGRQWYLLHPGLQLLAAPAAVTRGPGKVLRCSRLKACWQPADPKGKLNEESGGQQILQWYLLAPGWGRPRSAPPAGRSAAEGAGPRRPAALPPPGRGHDRKGRWRGRGRA